jgi:hypothetical protein
MKRIASLGLIGLLLATVAQAQSVTDRMIAALQEQGYDILEMHDTWLGRVRVIAESDTIRREIVFNPGTGEILRDYALDMVAMAARQADDDRVRAADRDGAPVTAVIAAEEVRATDELPADDFVLPEAIVTTPEE